MPPAVATPRSYLVATTLSAAGSAVGLLAATATLTLTNAVPGTGGLATAIFLAITAIAAAIAVPRSPDLAHRVGVRRLFVWLKAAGAVLWLIAGILLLAGLPPVPVLYCAAPLMGLTLGAISPITPLVNRAYLVSSSGMSSATAKVKAWTATGAVIGAALGGLLLDTGEFAWGLVANAVLTVPVVVIALRTEPGTAIPQARAATGIWRDLRALSKSDRQLRLVVLNACVVVMLIAPLSSLVVPIARSLRHEPLVAGSGLLLAAIYAGEMLTPWMTSRAVRGRRDLEASILTAAAAAAVLLVLAASALLISRRPELAVWAIAGTGFGMFRYSSRALTTGAAVAATSADGQARALAILALASSMAAPFGLLSWGLLLDLTDAQTTLLISSSAALVCAVLLRTAARRSPADSG